MDLLFFRLSYSLHSSSILFSMPSQRTCACAHSLLLMRASLNYNIIKKRASDLHIHSLMTSNIKDCTVRALERTYGMYLKSVYVLCKR